MMELDRRKRALLGVVVDAYVTRAEPVGSEWLAGSGNLGVKPATIRNELAEMTEMGYLRQPHTSAGRIPSDRGYRYYVDHLLAPDSDSSPRPRDFSWV
jgi:heat-inducible transcriptional repressor